MNDRLLAAYRQTTYRVTTAAGAIDLRVDTHNPALAALFVRHGIDAAAFLTAWNPRSALCSARYNAAANRRLQAAVAALGCDSLPGTGFISGGSWPGEESLLVLGIQRCQALALGRKFQQHAVVWAGPDAVPRLLLCEAEAGGWAGNEYPGEKGR